MSYFDEKRGIVLEDGDLEYKTPYFISHFWEFILGKPEDKPFKSNVDITK